MPTIEPTAISQLALPGALRELSGREDELVSQCGPNAARVANEALASCLAAPRETSQVWHGWVRGLPVAERDRLLLELLRRSVGDQVRSEVDCPECGSASEVELRLSRLPLKTERARDIDVELPDGRKIRLRPVTAGDQETLLDHGAGGLEDVLALVATMPREEIKRLDEESLRRLAEALDRANPDLDIRLSLSCHACGRDLEAPFDVEQFFCGQLAAHARMLLDDVHILATTYHWSEESILRLSWRRRLAYLERIDAERNAGLLTGTRGG